MLLNWLVMSQETCIVKEWEIQIPTAIDFRLRTVTK